MAIKAKGSANYGPLCICGKAPTVPNLLPIETKIYMAGNLADIITCAMFQDNIFWRYIFSGGRICHFPIDFCMDLATVQCYCVTCDKTAKLSEDS